MTGIIRIGVTERGIIRIGVTERGSFKKYSEAVHFPFFKGCA